MENEKGNAYSWWWDCHKYHKHSQWLETIISDLEKKTKVMLTLLQDEGDSFAQRAEMYYQKRPELLKLVGDFYRSYRSLAENYHQLKFESIQAAQSSSSTSSDSLKQEQELQSNTRKPNRVDDDFKLELTGSNPESIVEDPDLRGEADILNLDFSNKPTDGFILDKTAMPCAGLTDNPDIQNSGKLKIERNFELHGFLEEDSTVSNMGLYLSMLLKENERHQTELIRRNEEKRKAIQELHIQNEEKSEAIKELQLQLDRLREENEDLQNRPLSSVSTRQKLSRISRWRSLIRVKFMIGGGP